MRGRSVVWGGVLLVAVGVAVVGCSSAGSGTKPGGPPKPDSVVATPPMLDLSLVPARPTVVNARPTHLGVLKDKKTGKAIITQVPDTTVVVDTIAPDTNDAVTYYQAGLGTRESDPASAAAAFYWASRLNPAWAEPYFARWYVLSEATRPVVTAKGKTRGYFLTDSARKRLDSLVVLAQLHNPFFDEGLMLSDVSNNMHAGLALANSIQRHQVREVNQELMSQGEAPLMGIRDMQIERTWYAAYAQRHFDSASKELGDILKRHPDALQLYMYRAKAQFYLKQYDSAAATLTTAIGRVDKQDTAHIVPVYFSKDMFAYAIGMAQQTGHRDSASKATFQRTVTENLGFYMAHLHLGGAALTARDTVTALNEIRLASQIQPHDPVVQLYLGYALMGARHVDEAIEHLQAAVAVDPEYALSYYYLGQAYELQHDSAHSRSSYGDFLKHASRKDNLREAATIAMSVLAPPPAH